MSGLNIFVSFEYERDYELKNSFFRQAADHCEHKLVSRSIDEPYSDEEWKTRAATLIRHCNLVVVLVGQDTHNAPGVKFEVEKAQEFRKPVIQVVPQRRTYRGLPSLPAPIRWKWETINRAIARL